MNSQSLVSRELHSSLSTDPEMADLVRMFVADAPLKIGKFERALEAGDTEELRILAHQLKGAAPGYGFDDLAPIAKALEEACSGPGLTEEATQLCRWLIQCLRMLRSS